ncbi:hypothetical protein CAPTEDRAFT_190592 [Capitella teleta]|uniref:Uncharacterized protein n=1 Tax=Capitella teleta TaxID=283909 RepID=R7UJA4_CAPTE|nr:hypothetical protein CAPTEDRAFT_190592 [Capitella teleta]|eukprot:ELU03357.1 hypothetical protein CAPTEDRAFT_190592 [Capitella teleta]
MGPSEFPGFLHLINENEFNNSWDVTEIKRDGCRWVRFNFHVCVKQCAMADQREGTKVFPDKQDVFISGFRDCTSEALRFLIYEEGIRETDPVIKGLKEYLQSVENRDNGNTASNPDKPRDYQPKAEVKSVSEKQNGVSNEGKTDRKRVENFSLLFEDLIERYPRLHNIADDLCELFDSSEID